MTKSLKILPNEYQKFCRINYIILVILNQRLYGKFAEVIELPDGKWCAFEIKLGANQIDKAAETLMSLRDDILKDGGIAPSVLCVICGMSNAAYKRPDGVFVVPITALKN